MTPSIDTHKTNAQAAGTAGVRSCRSTGEEIRYATAQTSLGAVLVARSDNGVRAILLGENVAVLADDLQSRMPKAELTEGDDACAYMAATVAEYVEDPSAPLDFTLDAQGTDFQKRVWKALRAIPSGMTISYSELARQVGAPEAVRGVASACRANPIALAVPCHRVVAKDGSLGGYRWGLERKRDLLEREKRA